MAAALRLVQLLLHRLPYVHLQTHEYRIKLTCCEVSTARRLAVRTGATCMP